MSLQKFGGDWTEDKLNRVKEYLECYNVALKNQSFSREYIDAFAGTGYRELRVENPADDDGGLIFPSFAEPEVDQFLDGSAKIALKVQNGFHKFTFIERSPKKVKKLEELRSEFPNKTIRIEQGDANNHVRAICRESWSSRRAVLFLDPFGMQVSWETLKAVAATKSIDTWLLFPVGVAIIRLLKKDGKISEAWCQRLDYVFGDRSWKTALYEKPTNKPNTPPKLVQRSLLDLLEAEPEPEIPWKADYTVIENFFRDRLLGIFAKVAENSVWLKNSKGVPLYMLFFMAGNEKGAPIAVKMAEHIMSKP